MVLRGGRSRFVVESKWFEIVIEELGGRLEVDDQRWAFEWLEGNRKFRMERRLNKAGRFILCSVRDMEAKRYSIIFLEGKGQASGWNSLAVRLRGLGVTPIEGLKISNVPEFPVKPKGVLKVQWKEKGVEMKSFAEAVKSSPRRAGESVWLEVGENEVRGRLEHLKHCLIGRWGSVSVPPPELDLVRSWTRQFWEVKGKLSIAALGRGIMLFEFDQAQEAERVLARGKRSLKDNWLILDKWNPEVGCSLKNPNAVETWVVPAGSSSGKGGLRAGEEVDEPLWVDCCGSQRKGMEQLGLQVEVRDVACNGEKTLFPSVEASVDGTVERRWAGGQADLVEGVGSPLPSVWSTAEGAGRPKQELWPFSFQLWGSPRVLVQDARGEVDPLVGLPRDSTAHVSSQMMDRGFLTDEALCEEASSVSFPEGNEEEQTPLSIILADGSKGVLVSEVRSKWLEKDRGGGSMRGCSGSGWVPVGRQLLGEETKIQEMSQGVIHSLGVGRFLGWGAVDARGAAGGVVVFWDKRVLELVGLEVGIFSISCHFKNYEDGFMWFFTGVYGPTMKRFRELFWEELGAIRGLWTDPWCIGGDFNVIRFPSERSRVGRLSGPMRRFSEVLDELALRDMPLQGGPYTWSGGLNGQSWSRLDHFLISEDWENHFSGVSQCTLPRPVSDHYPILLDGGGVRRGPIPFRFENMWLKEEGFKELLRGWWQDEQDIQRGVVRAYQDLLSDPGGWHPSMSSLEFDSIGREEAARLEEMFSVEEVYLALSELNGDKAPGPDGFPIAFCPQERGAEDLRDYRPISLVGGLYKILAKVLANRLKKVVGKVVSSAQNAFVEGRQILDAALIANEAIDSMLKGDEAGVLCKLDLEKAFDHINWDFLMLVMQKMGFGEKWAGWIRWCISTASFSVMINGSPAGFF
ncbi:Transposon TX1 uncharacterized 149 kDa protein [Vitis vinifera]|uniref:Transposon TX1 uncharacterized 149 kDa protein n=1 Tax=Vitis vinifera TaxID=29760 RepID=A0A438D4H1_VITVI|nr:Transposon TX1 uncharacterized 149 kDa protein [Vitis vinifera]